MLLTCPKCRSGLEVPDGTAALVRCPACKTVFSPAGAGADADEEDDEEPEEDEERPKAGSKSRRAMPAVQKKGGDEPEIRNRDFDPITEEEDRLRKRKKRRDETRDSEVKAQRRREFIRAAIGVKLIWASFGLFMFSMALLLAFFFLAVFDRVGGGIVTAAGIVGLLNWLLAAVGVGLCLSGPRSPGHWTFGIAAAVAVAIHLAVLLTVAATAKGDRVSTSGEFAGKRGWAALPTRLDMTMLYLIAVIYPDEQGVTIKGPQVVHMVTGVLEMTRTVCILMLLSCLARSALDDELANKCTRVAGLASVAIGLLALLTLASFAFVIEIKPGLNPFNTILFHVVYMGVYAILVGIMLPALMAAREVADACDEPFQSLVPKM